MNRYFAWFGLPGSFVLTTLLSLSALGMALGQPSAARWLGFAAMVASSLGDIFLMRFGGVARSVPDTFVAGAACFMVSHLLYASGFLVRIRRAGYALLNPGMVLAVGIALACLWYFVAEGGMRSRRFPLAVVYLAIISVHLTVVFSYAWSAWRTQPLVLLAALGSLSFLVSDLIIGLGKLLYVTRYDHLIWWLYPIGQILLIAFSGR